MNRSLLRTVLAVTLVALAPATPHGQGRGGAPQPGDCPRDNVSFHGCAVAKAKTITKNDGDRIVCKRDTSNHINPDNDPL